MVSRGLLAFYLGACALALSACGGGSTSSGGALPADPPASTPAPTASPTPGPEIPLQPGQSFAYSGSLTQTQLRLIPAPMPTATTFATVKQTGSVNDGQTFDGVSGLYDASVAESDVTALQTSTSQTDTYYGFSSPAPGGASALLEYGSSWSDESGNTLSYTYGTPLVLAHLPETNGDSWSNGAAVTILENDSTDANGSAFFTKQVIAADGTYTETTDYPSNYGPASGESTITQNADGSGSITNVFGAGALVFGTPQPQSSGTYLLPFAIYAVPSPGPSDTPLQTGFVGAWYTVPPTLYHETDTAQGAQPIPAACNVPASVATAAVETQRTIARVDTILGYTDTQTTSEYRVSSFGAVCVQMNDTQNQYYDYNGDSQFILSPSTDPNYVPTPLQVSTTSETLALSSGTSPQSKRRSTSVSVAPLSLQAITAAQMRFDQSIERLRVLKKLSIATSLKSYIVKHQGGAR